MWRNKEQISEQLSTLSPPKKKQQTKIKITESNWRMEIRLETTRKKKQNKKGQPNQNQNRFSLINKEI